MAVKIWDGTKWVSEIPAGGTAGQVLSKASATDGDVAWADAAAGGGGSVDWQAAKPVKIVATAGDPGAGSPLWVEDTTSAYARLYLKLGTGGTRDQLELTGNYNNNADMWTFKASSSTAFTFSKGTGGGDPLQSRVHIGRIGLAVGLTGQIYWTNTDPRFTTAVADTTIARSATGTLTINGQAIQVAAAREDGTEVGLQDLVDEVAALRAEIAELRGRLDG